MTTLAELPSDQKEELLKQAREEVRPEVEAANNLAVAKLLDELRTTNEAKINQAVEEWKVEQKKNAKPLEPADIQKMLSKEYVTFKVMLNHGTEDAPVEKEFTIRELPQKFETAMLLKIKDVLVIGSQKLSGDGLRFEGTDWLEKLNSIMDLMAPALKTMAECARICLDPREKVSWLTADWIVDNLSNYRILAILQAQVEVNKLRDFFSQLFQSFQSGKIENPVDSLL